MDNFKLVQEKNSSSSLSPKQVQISQIKTKLGTSDGPTTSRQGSLVAEIIRASNSEAKLNRNFTAPQLLRKSSDENRKLTSPHHLIKSSDENRKLASPHHHRKLSDDVSRVLDASAIDTGSPIASVRDAVSKFGGATNWKAHRVPSLERRKSVQEHEKVQEDVLVFKKQSETAEESKKHILKDLDRITRLIEEHKLNLEKAQMEEHQAKQDSELAKLRVEEMEKEIANETSVAAKAHLEVAKGRNLAAASDLQSLKDESNKLRKDYASLMNHRDAAVKKAEKAVSSSKEVVKTVENLTVELRTTKASLESAHAAQLEAEHRNGAAKAQEQGILNPEKDLKQAEEELQKLDQKVLSAKDFRPQLDTASALLQDLKAELAAYMESKLKSETAENSKGNLEGQDQNTDDGIHAAIASAKKNLEEVNLGIEKAKNEVNVLKEAATPLKSQLESEKLALETIRQREEIVSVTVASTEDELNRTKAEISQVQIEREAKEEMIELPKKLQKASEEADKAKSLAKVAHEELQKAMEEVDQAKSRASITEGRLLEAKKEIEAAKAAEQLALATVNALQETETAETPDNGNSSNVITLSLDEYYKHNKQAQETEVQANVRVTESLSHAEAAKQSESRSLSKLEEVTSELATKKEELEIARQKAEKANEGKLSVEQELRANREQQQNSRKLESQNRSPSITFEHVKESKNSHEETNDVATNHEPSPKASEPSPKASELSNTESDSSLKAKKKKKKSLFPRFFMFLGKKKSRSKGH